jgi:hypothetical protein
MGMDSTTETASTYSTWPSVTAVVNTYERPALLQRALASVLAQSYKDFEVLVIHDGPMSADTVAVAAAGIDYFVTALDENSGYQCVPKNLALEHARGDYIAYLDDDNEWTEDHLEVLVKAIEEGTVWPDIVYGRREYVADAPGLVDGNGNPLYTGPSEFQDTNEFGMKRLAASPILNFIDTSDTLITRGGLYWLMHTTSHCGVSATGSCLPDPSFLVGYGPRPSITSSSGITGPVATCNLHVPL